MNKSNNKKSVSCDNYIEALHKIGLKAESLMKEDTTAEDYAFHFGMLNVCASMFTAIKAGEQTLKIGVNYKECLKAYKDAEKEADTLANQISIEDIAPKIFEVLDKYFEDKKKNKDKE
jgi:hypothetical protein